MPSLIEAFARLGQPWPFFLMMLGTSLGVIVGAVPGLTGAMLIALTLPLTFAMSYEGGHLDALTLLISMYTGSISGGLITATLLKIPGTPASMMTTLDAYPLAASGRPGRALGLGITASFVGGMVSCGFLFALARPMAEISLLLRPFDFFALIVMALALISSVSGGSLSRGAFAALLGVIARLPGTNPATGEVRWTGGITQLDDGLSLLPVLIGMFAVGKVIDDMLQSEGEFNPQPVQGRQMMMSLADWRRYFWNLLRSSLIGSWVGILPGVGANIGSAIAYGTARNFSRDPEKFGQGAEEGVIASEAANNATVGGALIPLISMGVPGSVIDAILLGALTIHRIQPGPMLFNERPVAVYTMMGAFLLSNIFMFVFMLLTARWVAKLIYVPRAVLAPCILVFCVAGSFALNNRMFDVWVMLAAGVAGFVMERCKIPLAPFVIGFVLAPLAEQSLGEGLQKSGGDYTPLLLHPVSSILLLIAIIMLFWPVVPDAWKPWKKAALGSGN